MTHIDNFRRSLTRRTASGLLLLVLSLGSVASASWKEKVLYSFQSGTDGAVPVGAVVFDKAGNLYGATLQGGADNCAPFASCGTVYQLAPPAKPGGAWIETVLHVFQGSGQKDGAYPEGGLVIDSQGNLYGTTGYGGTGDCVLLGIKAGCGTVYEMSPPKTKGGKWTEKVLYSFPTSKQGYVPSGDLTLDSAGNLYGATLFGGGRGTTCNSFYQYCGAVFELILPKTKGGKWTEKVLYGFKGVATGAQFGDGANPNGGLVFDSKGTIYGTTYFGGNNQTGRCEGGVGGTGCGIVFALQPPTRKGGPWTEKLVHRFNAQDGANSKAGVIFDAKGNLYGTTYGGAIDGSGAVFKLAAPTRSGRPWTETLLHRFSDGNDGANPAASLVFDTSGNLYGTTNSPTTQSARGNVFQMRPSTRRESAWTFGVIYTFKVIPDGESPDSSIVFDKAGDVYGTTQNGGIGAACQGGCGTLFEVSP